MSDEVAFSYHHLRYMQGSYQAVGNDGHHFNQSVNQGTNTNVPSSVADALYDGSDHLPVTMKIVTDVHFGVEEALEGGFEAFVAPNPATDFAKIGFFNPSQGQVRFDLYSLQGQLVQRESAEFAEGAQQFELSLYDLPNGFYMLCITHESGLRQTIKLVKN